MKIKEAKYKEVMVKQRQIVSHEVYGCDECRKEIKEFPNEERKLEMTIFHNKKESMHLHFCSWRCTLKYLPKIKSDYFATLPYIYFDERKKGRDELVKLLKSLSK